MRCDDGRAERDPLLDASTLHDDGERFADGDVAFVEQLAVALAPAPLSPALRDRLRALASSPRAARMAPRHWRAAVTAFSAAAAVLLAIIPGGGSAPRALDEPLPALTRADTADLLYAWSMSQWDAPIDYFLYELSLSISDVEGSLRDDADTTVPWNGSDAWDLPPTHEPSPRSEGVRIDHLHDLRAIG